ncbi:uncharacterized protein LOC110030726 isoform X2 [Phalaenopsis equestris]|uniref:uncharacterized protein LOC110030726 isoform X2 n=1 Tax=Phalaenopsis equestris TaxID=78828 RepID=UPI0009E2906C|nr:uncharacterized protein LOC110030726 isoform X2 [Phalaenopsis equestris]XP_020589273.1 uncharacterized protein LOC110030726 isoform X2 [Phalaenopsis equestris]
MSPDWNNLMYSLKMLGCHMVVGLPHQAGASLESLAKGAVQFSQRFTIQELEERWHALLYDLNTSTEASTRIVEIEIGVSVYNPSRPGRTWNSKIKKTSSGRRKGESLQCHYFTTRKKARSETHSSVKLGFPMSPISHVAIDNDSSSHHFKFHNEFALNKFHVDEPFSGNFGHPETSYGGCQPIYPKMVEVEPIATVSGLAVHEGVAGSIEAKLPVGVLGTDCSYGHGENISSVPIDEAGFNDAGDSFEPNFTPEDFPHALDRNHCSLQTSNAPGSTSTFHQLGYSSPPDHPIWKTIEDVSRPTLQMEGQFEEKGQELVTMQCTMKIGDQACDDATAKGKLNNDTATIALNNSEILLEANFIDFSDPCMSFTDDEELLLIDVDEDDIGDGSCLNGLGSIFLNSPTSTNIGNSPIPGDPKPAEAFDIPACNDAESSVEHGTIHEQIHNVKNDLQCSAVPEVCALSSTSGASPTEAPAEKLMICVLNAEDQDIPCNDNVTLPAKLFQAFPTNMRQDISSTMTHYGKATSGDSTLLKEVNAASVQPNVPIFKAGVGLLHSTVDCRLESLSSDRDLVCGLSTVSNKDMDNPSLIPAIASHSASDLSLKQDATTELNMQVACMPSHPKLVSSELGCVDSLPTMSISDREEEFFENEDDDEEDDVPNFSDVEAMILGMDLGPYDQESCLFAKEVSRYQCVDTKKTIIRLEQGARSYMNRAISSHGAFAIFYGRNLKYFIKSPEVLLGRETEEIKVDIDLAKEGRANKISRRQAIIKMDEDGCFHLKNIGKSSIFVNGKEVPVKKRINLCSCALIEIKDLRFIFETNELAVRRHIASSRQIDRGPKSEFDFVYS